MTCSYTKLIPSNSPLLTTSTAFKTLDIWDLPNQQKLVFLEIVVQTGGENSRHDTRPRPRPEYFAESQLNTIDSNNQRTEWQPSRQQTTRSLSIVNLKRVPFPVALRQL